MCGFLVGSVKYIQADLSTDPPACVFFNSVHRTMCEAHSFGVGRQMGMGERTVGTRHPGSVSTSVCEEGV